MLFRTLYKITATNKIQYWQIETIDNEILIRQGQLGGKTQVYKETIKEGKNIGRTNETTPKEQAQSEAKSKWEHKYNKDYKLTINECLESTEKIANRGGYLPMLAQSFDKHAERHLVYPCYVQPKLDGIKCISTTKTEDGVKLWFRSGKEITTMKHITNELEKIMSVGDIYDGELYIHGEDFNNFTGAIRANKNTNLEITNRVQYHIYDFPRIGGYIEHHQYALRYLSFLNLFMENKAVLSGDILFPVQTKIIHNKEEARAYYKEYIKAGYEGIIFRNISMPYEQKRSYNLLKFKEFIEDEFIIIGVEEGKGLLAGLVGSFICRLEEGRELKDMGGLMKKYLRVFDKRLEQYKNTISAKMSGKYCVLKHLFENPEEYLGKPLTIKYQNLHPSVVPRFPIGKSIRFDK